MIARKVFAIAEDLKIIEEEVGLLTEYLEVSKDRKIIIELEAERKPTLKLFLKENISKEILNILINKRLEEYNKIIEELKKEGIKITNVFEKEKIENKIKNYKKELDDLWGRGLFTRGEEVQKYIEELESKLKEL
jgi:hypothetical protein